MLTSVVVTSRRTDVSLEEFGMSDKISVGPRDESQKNSSVAGPVEHEETVKLDTAAIFCLWNGQEFPEGQLIESQGVTYECSLGKWVTSRL